MRQYVSRPGQECNLSKTLGWNALRGRHDTAWGFDFDGCSETRVGFKEENGAWAAFWKQAISMQKKHEWAAYSRHEMQWIKMFEIYFINTQD